MNQRNLFYKIQSLLIFFLLFSFFTSPVYAKVEISDFFGFGDIKSLGEGTSRLVSPVFSIATTLVVIYFLLGAFKYLKSGGNKEEVQGAREMITQAIVGFFILMFAFFVLQFLLSSLFQINIFPIGI